MNQYFAQAYKGKLIIRFDDTNPSKEKEEFQDSILEDLDLLGIKGDRITYSSDYFQEMYDYCVQMIKDGKAYCDDTPTEKMREERMDGVASARRDRSVEENLRIFTEEMKNGTEEGLKNCVRAKIDYKALNKTLRDPVIYRCNLTLTTELDQLGRSTQLMISVSQLLMLLKVLPTLYVPLNIETVTLNMIGCYKLCV